MSTTQEELKAAREWMAECATCDEDLERLETFSDAFVEKAIQREFDGGLEEFRRCMIPVRRA